MASGTMIYQGQAGHTYTFLALATDLAGNHELPPAGANAPQDTTTVNLGALPTVPNTTPPNFGIPPAPTVSPRPTRCSPRPSKRCPNAPPATNPSEFKTVLQPFQAQSFATGFDQSDGILGPMALAQAPDGSVLVSGGASRNELFRDSRRPAAPRARRWPRYRTRSSRWRSTTAATSGPPTGGGPLLQLDPTTGAIVNQFGDGVTLALAVNPKTEPDLCLDRARASPSSTRRPTPSPSTAATRTCVSRAWRSMTSGNLWAVTWPDARQVVEFDAHARAQVKLTFNSDIQSIAFGRQGTALDNLLFVSHDDAPNTAPGTVAPTPSDLTMVDVATLQQVAVAQGGTRGFDVMATSDGRLLISQSHEVDVARADRAAHGRRGQPAP